MRKALIKGSCLFAPVVYLCLFVFSCASVKQTKYFQDLPDSVSKVVPIVDYINPKIKVDDIMLITVNTVDPDASKIINAGNSANPANGVGVGTSINQQLLTGYSVDKEGNVEVPVLGKMHLAGLTTLEARDLIRVKANKFYRDPSVNIRFANFKITMLGEVNRPSTYIIPNETVTILDALGYAGDMTIYGKRENILVLRRDDAGKMTAGRLNIKSTALMSSPFFYLQQNDVVYVETSKAKLANTDAGFIRYVSLGASLISLLVILKVIR